MQGRVNISTQTPTNTVRVGWDNKGVALNKGSYGSLHSIFKYVKATKDKWITLKKVSKQ